LSLFNCIYSALRKYFSEVLDIEWSVKKLLRPRKDRILRRERLTSRLLNVPYAHITFTMPHLHNSTSTKYPGVIYNILLRSAWKTIKILAHDQGNIGARPGMIAVLHTWGSDLKYHVHGILTFIVRVHTLVTFGGLDNNYNWVFPKRSKIIDLIEPALKRNSLTIKTFFSILKQILGLEDPSFSKCIFCGSRLLTIDIIKPDSLWHMLNIRHFKINKDPPFPKRNIIKNL